MESIIGGRDANKFVISVIVLGITVTNSIAKTINVVIYTIITPKGLFMPFLSKKFTIGSIT